MHQDNENDGRVTGEEAIACIVSGLLDGLLFGLMRLGELARHRLAKSQGHQQDDHQRRDHYRR